MTDNRVQILAEHLMSGRQITVAQLQARLLCGRQYATELLNQATQLAEEFNHVQQTKKQNKINAQRQAERRANSNAARRNRR